MIAALLAAAVACAQPVSVCGHADRSSVQLIARGHAIPVVVDAAADPAVRRVADAFAGDMSAVAGSPEAKARTDLPTTGEIVLIGEAGHSLLIDQLISAGRVPARDLAGRWEAYRQIVVERPFPGISRALVIVGADRRGAVFGAFDLSEKIGVSPWRWWADVPVHRRADLWLTAGEQVDAPKVRYRGIFINDEEPSFGTWARKKFGGINAKLYEHVFDLTLRLKGNLVWPAMWGKAIGADDPASMPLADAMGVVLGTSHHEPMTRAQDEWHRPSPDATTGGAWDYRTNAANLRAFWRGGIRRMMSKGDGRGYEQLVTVGMRGDGDEPMSAGTATHLLEVIVADQRAIIADVTKRPASETPQVWALYKEVQDYFDAGMKVPDDVTLLFSDDNWGQIRRLPTSDLARRGGYGVYYHFDYVGGPRSYKWLNNTQVEKTWQQMDLAYRRGARALWIANVGDLKPMEVPISFFMAQAWNPEAMTADAMAAWSRGWARETFGDAEIGDILDDYARLAARRKPELVDADAFPLGPMATDALDGGAFGRMVADWDALERRVAAVKVAPDTRDAFFQLVEFPVAAMANLYRLHYAVAWNRRLAAAGDARANAFADRAEAAFARDRALRDAYHALNGGKWNGTMLQTHIGYTGWKDPDADVMPKVTRVAGAARPIVFRNITAPTTGRSVEAGEYVRARGGKGLTWRVVPRLGRTAGAIGTFPQALPATTPADGVRVDYALELPQAGDATLRLYLVPALDTTGGAGLRIGVSVDRGAVQVLTLALKVDTPAWERAVEDNVAVLEARFPALKAGRHTVALTRIDDGVLVQRLELFAGDVPASYLPPQ